MTPRHRTQGFTLMELVCVIVVLGILSATAIPRFVDFSREARIAKLNDLSDALHNTAQYWHSVCVLSNTTACLNSITTMSHNGIQMQFSFGYPNAGDRSGVDEIDVGITYSGFSVNFPDNFHHEFRVIDAPNPASCWVGYCINHPSTPAGCRKGRYSISMEISGC